MPSTPEPFRVVVVGLGNQGRKRRQVAGADLAGCVDPVNAEAAFRRIEDVPLESYDAALVCTPEEVKIDLLTYLLGNGKHVLVEKPLLACDNEAFDRLEALARHARLACYTAYNHRFDPAIRRLAHCLADGEIGEIYQARLCYGNGTARDVYNSVWRDSGDGVLTDLGSHLLDLAEMLFDRPVSTARPVALSRFENRAFDHCVFTLPGRPQLDFEVTLLSWKNSFSIDVIGSKGSAHVQSLVKWGPATFTRRLRVLPSGRPDEDSQTWVQADPTWSLEYQHFKELCRQGGTTLAKDRWINATLSGIAATGREPS